jgi:hypothetical protein
MLIATIGGVGVSLFQYQKVSTIQDTLSIYNPPVIDTSDLSATEVVETYFDALRNQRYDISCGLETTRQCLSDNPTKYRQYQTEKKNYWFTKLVNGENLLQVWQYPDSKQ